MANTNKYAIFTYTLKKIILDQSFSFNPQNNRSFNSHFARGKEDKQKQSHAQDVSTILLLLRKILRLGHMKYLKINIFEFI